MDVFWISQSDGDRCRADALWEEAVRREWIPNDVERVVIHVAAARADVLARNTARALVELLVRRPTPPRIDIIDPGTEAAEWQPGAHALDLASQRRYRLEAARLRDGAAVAELWLDEFFLVTIAGAAPDARLGLRSILAAQSTPLDAPGTLDLDVVVAAHRLIPSSLCVSCGSVTFGVPASGSWWAASPDDVALERAVAAAAGMQPDALPILRHLARHETMEEARVTIAGTPTLRGYLQPEWRVRVRRWSAAIAHVGRRAGSDLRAGAQNLGRLPAFLQRRLPGIPGARKAA